MTYKDVLEDSGFTWDSINEYWKKSKGFGMSTTVEHIMTGLFTIIVNGKVVFDGFIKSLDEFKSTIKSYC